MAEIYGLFSGRDGRVQYVGKTKGSRHARFKEHERSLMWADGGYYQSYVYGWIQQEYKACFPVTPALLELCSYEECDHLETKWMSKFPDLLNDKKYYYCGGKPPVIPEIRDYMRTSRH
jgi:hypothetical protein